MPSTIETITVRQREHEPALRQIGPERLEERVEPLGEREPDEEPDQRRERAEHEPLDDHDAQHLAARRADGAQRRELARALGDRDRERVRDHERADEQRDAAEGEQEVLEERELVARRPSSTRCA